MPLGAPRDRARSTVDGVTARLIPPFALLFVVLAFAVLPTLAQVEPDATCLERGCYCEAVAHSGVRQPIDAYSSIAPAIAGAFVLWRTLRRRRGPDLADQRAPGLALGLAACSIAVFSFYYHATLTWRGEYLDGVSLYLLAGFPIAWTICRALGDRGFGLVYIAVAAGPAVLSALVPEVRKPAFLLLALLAVTAEVVRRATRRTRARGVWLAVAVTSFGVALVAWWLDWTRTVCSPHGAIQLHAVWHALSAPTIMSLHAYYASEGTSSTGPRHEEHETRPTIQGNHTTPESST